MSRFVIRVISAYGLTAFIGIAAAVAPTVQFTNMTGLGNSISSGSCQLPPVLPSGTYSAQCPSGTTEAQGRADPAATVAPAQGAAAKCLGLMPRALPGCSGSLDICTNWAISRARRSRWRQ